MACPRVRAAVAVVAAAHIRRGDIGLTPKLSHSVDMPDLVVIIPAAGSSTRFGGGRNKLLETLGGRTVISRAVEAFLSRRDVVGVVIPTGSGAADWGHLARDSRVKFCSGGETRAHSVYNALKLVPERIEW